jgi:hypothetical protein
VEEKGLFSSKKKLDTGSLVANFKAEAAGIIGGALNNSPAKVGL